jgi:hypothetical protein
LKITAIEWERGQWLVLASESGSNGQDTGLMMVLLEYSKEGIRCINGSLIDGLRLSSEPDNHSSHESELVMVTMRKGGIAPEIQAIKMRLAPSRKT